MKSWESFFSYFLFWGEKQQWKNQIKQIEKKVTRRDSICLKTGRNKVYLEFLLSSVEQINSCQQKFHNSFFFYSFKKKLFSLLVDLAQKLISMSFKRPVIELWTISFFLLQRLDQNYFCLKRGCWQRVSSIFCLRKKLIDSIHWLQINLRLSSLF